MVLTALGYRFLWPLVKDHWLVKKALEFVYLMEETYGGGTGAIKFEKSGCASEIVGFRSRVED